MLTEQAHAFVDQLAKALELIGVAIIVGGIALATLRFIRDGSRTGDWQSAYPHYRSNIGRGILLGLERRHEATSDGIAHARKDDRDRPRLALDGSGRRGRACQDDVGLQADQLLRERSYPIDVSASPPKVDPHVAAIGQMLS